jgi:hypothetical protein
MRPDLTLAQISAIRTMLADQGGDDDEPLRVDMLEGSTDLFELAGRLLSAIEDEEGSKAVLIAQVQDRNDRKARVERRIESYRDTLRALIEAAGTDKLALPEATVTMRKVAPKLIVTDPDALPDALCRITRKPDMAAIKEFFSDNPDNCIGVTLDNGGLSMTIRRR